MCKVLHGRVPEVKNSVFESHFFTQLCAVLSRKEWQFGCDSIQDGHSVCFKLNHASWNLFVRVLPCTQVSLNSHNILASDFFHIGMSRVGGLADNLQSPVLKQAEFDMEV